MKESTVPVEKKTQVSFHLAQDRAASKQYTTHTQQSKGHKKQPELKRVGVPSAHRC